jgi:purine-binding chemotaxis protein CheW
MADYCTLDLQGRSYAISFECLREVIEPPLLTPVPLAPTGVRGVVNLRGELLPVLALDPLLDLATPESVLARRPWMAVFQSGLHTFGVLAGGVGTTRDADMEPTAGKQPSHSFVEGLLAVPEPKSVVINLPALMQKLGESLNEATSFSNLSPNQESNLP